MDPTKLTLPVILAFIGAGLIVLALARTVETRWITLGPLSNFGKILSGVIGVLALTTSVYIYLHSQPTLPCTSQPQGAAQDSASPPAPADTNKVKLELINLIKNKQHAVRDSTGLNNYDNFTRQNLDQFKRDRVPEHIADDLKNDERFEDLVSQIKSLNPDDRQKVLDAAETTYRLSWSQLGLNPATASAEDLKRGQSEAGSEAERMIAESIVNLIREQCKHQ